MDIDGRHFELTHASHPDAMALELDEVTGGQRVSAAEIRVEDADARWTFSGYMCDLPLAVVEWLVREGRRRLGPSNDEV